MAINQWPIPNGPGLFVGRRCNRHGFAPSLAIVRAEPARGVSGSDAACLIEHQLTLAEISQACAQTDRCFAIVPAARGMRIRPRRSAVVAGQDEGAMRIIATDEHQQPVLLWHVDDVGNCYHSVPTLGDDLKSRRKPDATSLAGQLPDFVRLPAIRSG